MNNRQANNNGRRRGRGGQQQGGRSGGGQGQRDNGNRIDNRARGNAAQLLEKYKNLARDAQMQGDRVNTEYYLQFADHYFRVLSESRARFEENNPGQQRQRPENDDDDDFGFDGVSNGVSNRDEVREEPREEREDRGDRQQREDRGPREDRAARGDRGDRQREDRGDRGERGQREDRGPRQDRQAREDRGPRENPARANGNGNGHYQDAVAEGGEEAPSQSRRGLRPRRDAAPVAEVSGLDLAVLPPAIAIETDDAVAEDKPKRRGRPRKDADASAA